jgi:hypothetical protein
MELLTSFYYPNNSERLKELELTLNNNLTKTFITKINLVITNNDYIIFKNSDFINHLNFCKINIIINDDTPTYKYLFNLASTFENIIICICNSDIEFFIPNIEILNMLNDTNCFFITRHEDINEEYLISNFGGSHDAFIFKSNSLKTKLANKDVSYINYKQNTPGIESLLTLFCINELHYKITNPCFEIKLLHHHKSNHRTYSSMNIIGHTSPHRLGGIYSNTIWCNYMIYPCLLINK